MGLFNKSNEANGEKQVQTVKLTDLLASAAIATVQAGASASMEYYKNLCNIGFERYDPNTNTVNGMQGALKVIYEISNKLCCLDIYGSLCELESFDNISLESKVARDQIEEEFYKAKYQKDNDELKQEFIEAEKYSFFKGCIRFMLWNEEKEYVGTLFKEKYKRAQELFSNEDTLEGKIHNKDCFAQYLCACTKLENIISNDNNGNGCIRFNNSGEGITAVANGKLDVGAFGSSAPMVYISKGSPITIFAGQMSMGHALVAKPEKAAELADLYGNKT